jgi:hypothetical protein
LDQFGRFTTNNRHIKGIDNNVADTLSRIEAIGKSVHHQTLVATQEKGNEMREIITAVSYALQLKKVRIPDQGVGTYCDIST